MQNYLEQLKQKNYSSGTIKVYRYIFRQFENLGFGKIAIKKFQEKIVNLSPVTRQSYLICLRKILKEFKPELCKMIIIPKVPKVLPKNIPNQEEMKRILQLPDTLTFQGIRDKTILELLYSSGLRRKEVTNLLVEDIDSAKHIIRITQGKMRKDRLIPISSRAVQWIRKYSEYVRPNLKPKSNHLFLSSRGTQISVNTVYLITKKYSKYSTHSFRHAFSTHLLQNGMKETSLQSLLGHSQITTTQRYTQVTGQELKETYRKYHGRDKWALRLRSVTEDQ